jgi:menaquinone-specific isochorismate synthase
MTTVPATSDTEPAAGHRRARAPQADQIRALLEEGAVFAWSDDHWIIGWGNPRKSPQPHPGKPSFYAPDFLLSDAAPWRVYPESAGVSPDALARELTGSAAPSRAWRPFDEAAFAGRFREVQAALRDGTLRKAVPAVFDRSGTPLGAGDRGRALRALANLPAGLMPYGTWDGSGGVLGAAPEILFEYDTIEIHTMAVAGTARAGTAPEAMMDDPKERAEHRFVLEDLEAQLASLGPVTRGATRPWRIGLLSHLRTDLRVAPAGAVRFDDLVRRLHPTPAVGTAPRETSLAAVTRFDLAPRGRFAAPFGLVLPGGAARCLVAIRNVQWDRTSARCGAGCGILPDSRLARETAELRLKLAATRGNLGL